MINTWIYPGGEVGVRVLSDLKNGHVFRIQNSNDFMAMVMTLNACLQRNNYISEVTIPYLPYARQDRVATEGDPFAIDVIAYLLEKCGVKKVNSYDVHSQKSINVFKSQGIELNSISPLPYIVSFISRMGLEGQIYLVSPDKGALHKVQYYYDILRKQGLVSGIIVAEKVRDPISGKLNGFTLIEKPSVKANSNLIITDDICDGGGTFLGISDVLKKEYGTEHNNMLFTTHGIYSKGIDILLEQFRLVASTNSFLHGITSPNLITININEN